MKFHYRNVYRVNDQYTFVGVSKFKSKKEAGMFAKWLHDAGPNICKLIYRIKVKFK